MLSPTLQFVTRTQQGLINGLIGNDLDEGVTFVVIHLR